MNRHEALTSCPGVYQSAIQWGVANYPERQHSVTRSIDGLTARIMGRRQSCQGFPPEQGASMDNHSTSRPDDEAIRDKTVGPRSPSNDTPTDLVTLPDEEVHPPPPDVDERSASTEEPEVISLPNNADGQQNSGDHDFEDEIDEHMPLPVEEDYHDGDRVGTDSHDVRDEVDEVAPLPTGDAWDHTDDFSTDEELDVDTAPSGPDPGETREAASPENYMTIDPGSPDAHSGSSDRVRFVSPSSASSTGGTPVYMGGPSDNDPVNDESTVYSSSYASGTTDINDDGAHTTDEELRASTNTTGSPTPPLPPPGLAGITTCPVCGQSTNALRFCGYCGTQLTENRYEFTATTFMGRAEELVGMLLEPLARWTRPATVRLIMMAGAALVLLALLANSGGLALIFGAMVLPLILVFWCLHKDLFENEPLVIIAGFGVAGTLIGGVLGWLASLVVTNSWIERGILNYGAAGYGGLLAERAGNPPFVVWTLAGILLPLLALAAIVGGPLAMRQTISLRNEVMDGLTLGAVMGAGYSIGTAVVFASPMVTQGGPESDASSWTLTTIGLTILRPLIWTLSGGMLGAAAWRYLLTGTIGSSLVPALVGSAVPLLFTLVSVQISSAGLWPEFLWGLLMAAIAGSFFSKTVNQAIRHDRRILGNDGSRTVCTSCHQVTPAGRFCSHCGSDLTANTSSVPRVNDEDLQEAK